MSGLNDGNRKDYSEYDRMSTESLEELLRLDAQLPEGEESDIDAILYISEVIAKREMERPTGRYVELDVDAAWETFQTQYRPYFKDGRSLYDFDGEPSPADGAAVSDNLSPDGEKRVSARGRRRLGRTVLIVAAVAVLFSLMTATAYAVGFDLWGAFAQWTKDTFTFVPASAVDDPGDETDIPFNEEEYADLQAALDMYGIEEPLAPTWIPDGFVVDSVSVDENSDPMAVVFQTGYVCDDQWIIIQINMYQDVNSTTYWDWEKDDVDISTIEIKGDTIYMMENAGRQCAAWSSGPFECSIISDLSPEELYKLIESIYVRNE